MTGLYLHIPFCARKCPYCDFYSVRFDRQLVADYTAALVRNIRHLADADTHIDSIYFGGGTPSLLCSAQVESVLDAAAASFSLSACISSLFAPTNSFARPSAIAL